MKKPLDLKIVIILFLVIYLASCVSTSQKFEKPKQEDTILGYKLFLTQYPDSEYTSRINQRIEELTKLQVKKEQEEKKLQEEKKRKRREELQMQISKLKGYRIGTLTERKFFADGWNGGDHFLGKIGILTMITTSDSSMFGLGTSTLYDVSAANSTKSSLDFMIKAYGSGIGGVNYDTTTTSRTTNDDMNLYICVLKFKEKILNDMKCRFQE